jgi:hypothetical protein
MQGFPGFLIHECRIGVHVGRQVYLRLRHVEEGIGMSGNGLPGFLAVEDIIRRRRHLLRKSRIGTKGTEWKDAGHDRYMIFLVG